MRPLAWADSVLCLTARKLPSSTKPCPPHAGHQCHRHLGCGRLVLGQRRHRQQPSVAAMHHGAAGLATRLSQREANGRANEEMVSTTVAIEGSWCAFRKDAGSISTYPQGYKARTLSAISMAFQAKPTRLATAHISS